MQFPMYDYTMCKSGDFRVRRVCSNKDATDVISSQVAPEGHQYLLSWTQYRWNGFQQKIFFPHNQKLVITGYKDKMPGIAGHTAWNYLNFPVLFYAIPGLIFSFHINCPTSAH